MQIVAWSLIKQTEQNRNLKETTKALLKGPQNDLKELRN